MLQNENIYRDAEQLVIAALLIEKSALMRVVDVLKPEMFYLSEHRVIYACIESMNDQGKPVDLITVADALKNNAEVEKAGGISYLAETSGRLVSTVHLEQYACIVFDAYLNRRLVLFATQLVQQAKTGEPGGEELLLLAHEQLSEIDHAVPVFNALKDAPTVIAQSQQAGMERIERYRQGLTCAGITTALPALDNLLGGWQDGELIVLAARPSIGKTALALHFAQAAIQAGKNTLIYSLEMSAERLGDRLIVSRSNVQPDHWRFGSCNIYDLEAIDTACRTLSGQSFYIDDTSQRSLGQIRSSAKRMKQRGLCDLIIIDYLQLAEMKTDHRNYNRTDLVSEASSDAKRLAKELQVPVLLLSQLNRGLETRPGKRPELADLRDSGAIEQDADVVLLIHRPEFYGILEDRHGNPTKGRGELLVAKNRNGGTGTVLFGYNPSLTRIGAYEGKDNL
jgi:replicative DNA helicase